MSHQLTIVTYEKTYAICRLEPDAPVPEWAGGVRFLSITRTANELSIVCEEELVPNDVHAERNRRLMLIEGTMPFTLPGVLASVAGPLADGGISVFAVSTYDTDYIFVSDEDLQEATQVLERAGHTIRQNPSE
jgi:uncharacterized protein